MKVTFLLLLGLSITTHLSATTNYEDFDAIEGFPVYQCILDNREFVLVTPDGSGNKKLKAANQTTRLHNLSNKLRRQIINLRNLRHQILIGTPANRSINKFRKLYSQYFSSQADLSTQILRLQALKQLRIKIQETGASIKKNLDAITNCISRNWRWCSFDFNLAGNLSSAAAVLSGGAGDIPVVSSAGSAGIQSTTTYQELANKSAFNTVFDLEHFSDLTTTLELYFFKTAQTASASTWVVRAYRNAEYSDAKFKAEHIGLPRLIGSLTLNFDNQGRLTTASEPEMNTPILGTAFNSMLGLSFYVFESKPAASGITEVDEQRECF